MNKKLPGYLLEKNRLVGTVTFSVLFALIFLNLYIPFSDTAWFGLGNSQTFLFTAGFAFISILIMVISRTVMYHTSRLWEFTYLGYVLWCIMEVLLICAFYTFVTVDVVRSGGGGWIQVFSRALLYGSISLIIPYILTGMYFTIMEKNKTIRLMNSPDVVSDEQVSSKAEGKITLFGNIIYLNFSQSQWNEGSFMAFIMLLLVGISMLISRKFDKGEQRVRGGGLW